MGVGAGRHLAGWEVNGGMQLQHSSSVASALPVTQSGFSWSAAASRRVVGDWHLVLNTTNSHTRVDDLSGSDAGSRSYAAAFSGRKIDFSGNYSQSNGTSIMTATGLFPVNPGEVILPETSLIVFNGSSYAFATTFHPKRQLNISADYSHALYSTVNPTTSTTGELVRYDARVEYLFRHMHIGGGYAHLSQGFGALLGHPSSTNAFSFGISRSFDIF